MTDYKTTPAYNELKVVIDDIKSIKIQGATAIAVEGVKAFARYLSKIDLKQPDLIAHVKAVKDEIGYARDTEPGLRNGLQFVYNEVIINEQRENIEMLGDQFDELLKEAEARIQDVGANKIQTGDVIYTHCHSSQVVGVLRRAAKMGKKFEVINSETRPKYQGRKTAKELVEAGIKTTHVVDSAAWMAMKQFDVNMVLLGIDSITVEGTALNKVGSRAVALAAHEQHIPLYHVSSLLKFDPETMAGHLATIEMRDIEEIWPEKERPKNLNLWNPSFDTVAREYIAGFLCEFGIVPPQAVFYVFNEKYSQFRREGF